MLREAMEDEDLIRIEIFEEMVSRGCCKRCVLRYLGYSKTELTFDFPDTCLTTFDLLLPSNEMYSEDKKIKPNPCTLCLGLLEDEILDEMLSHEALAQCWEYKHKTFAPYITLPLNMLVRDYSMKLYLKRIFPEFFDVIKVIKIDQAWWWTIEERLVNIVGKEYNPEDSDFSIHFYLEYPLEEEEMSTFLEFAEDSYGVSLNSGRTILDLLETLLDHELTVIFNISVPPEPSVYAVTLKDLKYISKRIHLIGRICKYSRGVMRTKRSGPNVADVLEKAVANANRGVRDAMFQTTNWDEKGVRIFERGGNFHLDLLNPTFENISPEVCRQIERYANKCGCIRIRNLKEAQTEEFEDLMDSEKVNPRTYKLLCLVTEEEEDFDIDDCINAINMHETLTVCQKTPVRIFTQRQCWNTKKKIFYIQATKIKDNLMEVDICAETGLYILEFINGDSGHTKPSMSDIIKAKVEVVTMDVVTMDMVD